METVGVDEVENRRLDSSSVGSSDCDIAPPRDLDAWQYSASSSYSCLLSAINLIHLYIMLVLQLL